MWNLHLALHDIGIFQFWCYYPSPSISYIHLVSINPMILQTVELTPLPRSLFPSARGQGRTGSRFTIPISPTASLALSSAYCPRKLPWRKVRETTSIGFIIQRQWLILREYLLYLWTGSELCCAGGVLAGRATVVPRMSVSLYRVPTCTCAVTKNCRQGTTIGNSVP
jgi:hypothetical protein